MVEEGETLRISATGRTFRVGDLLGEGSQGAVYTVEGGDGAALALKWYFPASATAAQRIALAELVDRGAPSLRFLWPIEVTDPDERGRFGYLMPLRPARYLGLVDLLTGRVDVAFSKVCRLCLELAFGFLELHSEGLCYRDISFANVFFDPSSGEVLICDNDNVGVDGAEGVTGVLGTRRFMAPEIVRREAAPSSASDLYSLAVLLFYVLMMGHPLVGRRELEFDCWDERAEGILFGTQPRFVFDPTDDSNAPVPDLHSTMVRYWQLYPAFVRDLFISAFTEGLTDPRNGRVRESVWRTAMARLGDTVVRCEACAKENFYDPTGPGCQCWNCGRFLTEPVWFVTEQSRVALGAGRVIYRHHLTHDYDFATPVAEVVPHPSRVGLWGLRNLGTDPWRATLPDGTTHTIEPERTVRLIRGTALDAGHFTATCA